MEDRGSYPLTWGYMHVKDNLTAFDINFHHAVDDSSPYRQIS